jgi:tripartite-type tricarboxylate transporter receptor subunit TctC
VQAGSLKSYAVTSARRLSSMPNVPTVVEAGLPGLEISVWHGLYVPTKTPDAVAQKLTKALADALKDPALVKRFEDISTIPTPEKATPDILSQTLKSEIERWRPLITAAGQYAD